MSTEVKINRYCALAMPVLFFVLILALFAIVFSKDLARRRFIQYQTLLRDQSSLQLEQGKLMYQQSALTTQSRVQALAEKKLAMQLPTQRKLLVVAKEASDA